MEQKRRMKSLSDFIIVAELSSAEIPPLSEIKSQRHVIRELPVWDETICRFHSDDTEDHDSLSF